MKVNTVIQANHHPQLRPALPLLHRAAHPIQLRHLHHLLARLGRQIRHVLWPKRHPPHPMDPRHGPDKVAIRHVRQRIQMRLVPALAGYRTPRPHPQPTLALIHRHARVVGARDFNPLALKRPVPRPLGLVVPVLRRRVHALGQRRGMVHLALARASLAHKAYRRRKDAPPSLPRLHRARRKRPPVAHPLDVEHERDRVGPREQEVAVAGVREEVVGYRLLR